MLCYLEKTLLEKDVFKIWDMKPKNVIYWVDVLTLVGIEGLEKTVKEMLLK